jgi:phage baseplate assembly protein W
MAQFYGYSSIGRNKKFRLENLELIKRDLLNNLLIRQGTLPGRPNVGTDLWNYLFESIDDATLTQLDNEMRKSIQRDPRVKVEEILFFTQDNGLLCEISVKTVMSSTTEMFRLFLNTDDLTATYV